MRKLIVCLIVTLFASCSKDEIEYQNDFDKSYDTWLQFSKANNNTYSYTKEIQSWVGFTIHTIIHVDKSKVVKREFQYYRIGSNTIPQNGWTKNLAIDALKEIGYAENEIKSIFGEQVIDKLQWVENKENLGRNGNEAELITLEQIYAKAKNEWIIKRDKASIYFETKNNGLISTAGYVLEKCMDDCFVGIKIINIQE